MEIGVLSQFVVNVCDIRHCGCRLLIVACLIICVSKLIDVLTSIVVGLALVNLQIGNCLGVHLLVVESLSHYARHLGLALCVGLVEHRLSKLNHLVVLTLDKVNLQSVVRHHRRKCRV